MYGRREKRGREAGFPRWREAGEKGEITQHCAIFRNRKNAKWREPGLKGTGSGRFKPPCPPPPPHSSGKFKPTRGRHSEILPTDKRQFEA